MAYIHIFDVYNIEQSYDRGIFLANQYNQKFPDNYIGYYALGRYYNGIHEIELTRSSYEKAIELNPEFRGAAFNYLDFLISLIDIDAALSLLSKMEKNASYSNALPRVWGQYANVYTALEDYDEAYDAFEKAFGFASTDDIKGIISREEAELDILLGKVTTGIRKMSMSLGLLVDRRRKFETLIEMSFTLISHGEYDLALSLADSMDSYLESAEREITQGFLKGIIQLRTGNTESAIQIAADMQNVILNEDRKIRDKYLLNILNAEIQAAGGEYKKAIAEYKFIPEDEGLQFKSEILRKLGRYGVALGITEQMQKPGRFISFIEFALSYYQRGLIYEDMGNAELAIENYEKLLDLWKDGDKKLPARLDAQKRLSKLKRNM